MQRAAGSADGEQQPALEAGPTTTTAAAAGRAARSAGPWRPPGRITLAVGTAVVLAGASLAGCAVLRSPSALSGMERQIARGERVSAATRAHAGAGPGPAATGGGTGPAGTGPGGTGPGGTGPGGTAGPTPQATLRAVPGRMVTAIGDSVMAASAMALQAALPGIYIDAKPDREMPAGLAIVRRLAADGRLRPVVVIGLGTNYLVTTGQLNELMRLLGPRRKLVLINTFVPDSWSKQVNATEAAFIGTHPSVTPADWYDTIKNRTYLLWPDDVHPEMPGTYVYARMVNRAVQATRTAPFPAPVPAPAVRPLPHPLATAAS